MTKIHTTAGLPILKSVPANHLQVRKFAHLSLRSGASVKIRQAALELVRSGRAKTAAGAAEKTGGRAKGTLNFN